MIKKTLALVLSFALFVTQTGFAQSVAQVNFSGYLNQMHQTLFPEKFRPVHLRYFSYDNVNNQVRILMDKGDMKDVAGSALEKSGRALLRYFLVGVSLPNDTWWVNLRPDAQDQIIDDLLAQTDVGKIMLEADLQLKKDTAQFTSPQTPEGKEYWDKLYQKAGELFGNDSLSIPTLTRPWIVPHEIIIRETNNSAYVYKATMKVMLEQDHLKNSSVYNFTDPRLKALNEFSSQLIRERILPKLTLEVNTAKRYAPLRQVFYSLVLARWFKAKFAGKDGLYAQRIDRKDLNGLTSRESWSTTTYFNQYKESFSKGEYNIQEPVSTVSGQVIRNYFSGGIAWGAGMGPGTAAGESSPGAFMGGQANVPGVAARKGTVLGGQATASALVPNDLAPSSLSVSDFFRANFEAFMQAGGRTMPAASGAFEIELAKLEAAVGEAQQKAGGARAVNAGDFAGAQVDFATLGITVEDAVALAQGAMGGVPIAGKRTPAQRFPSLGFLGGYETRAPGRLTQSPSNRREIMSALGRLEDTVESVMVSEGVSKEFQERHVTQQNRIDLKVVGMSQTDFLALANEIRAREDARAGDWDASPMHTVPDAGVPSREFLTIFEAVMTELGRPYEIKLLVNSPFWLRQLEWAIDFAVEVAREKSRRVTAGDFWGLQKRILEVFSLTIDDVVALAQGVMDKQLGVRPSPFFRTNFDAFMEAAGKPVPASSPAFEAALAQLEAAVGAAQQKAGGARAVQANDFTPGSVDFGILGITLDDAVALALSMLGGVPVTSNRLGPLNRTVVAAVPLLLTDQQASAERDITKAIKGYEAIMKEGKSPQEVEAAKKNAAQARRLLQIASPVTVQANHKQVASLILMQAPSWARGMAQSKVQTIVAVFDRMLNQEGQRAILPDQVMVLMILQMDGDVETNAKLFALDLMGSNSDRIYPLTEAVNSAYVIIQQRNSKQYAQAQSTLNTAIVQLEQISKDGAIEEIMAAENLLRLARENLAKIASGVSPLAKQPGTGVSVVQLTIGQIQGIVRGAKPITGLHGIYIMGRNTKVNVYVLDRRLQPNAQIQGIPPAFAFRIVNPDGSINVFITQTTLAALNQKPKAVRALVQHEVLDDGKKGSHRAAWNTVKEENPEGFLQFMFYAIDHMDVLGLDEIVREYEFEPQKGWEALEKSIYQRALKVVQKAQQLDYARAQANEGFRLLGLARSNDWSYFGLQESLELITHALTLYQEAYRNAMTRGEEDAISRMQRQIYARMGIDRELIGLAAEIVGSGVGKVQVRQIKTFPLDVLKQAVISASISLYERKLRNDGIRSGDSPDAPRYSSEGEFSPGQNYRRYERDLRDALNQPESHVRATLSAVALVCMAIEKASDGSQYSPEFLELKRNMNILAEQLIYTENAYYSGVSGEIVKKGKREILLSIATTQTGTQHTKEGLEGKPPATVKIPLSKQPGPTAPGGIDFRSMNIIAKPMGIFEGLKFTLPLSANAATVNLNQEFAQLNTMVDKGLIPSGRRIKELIAACYAQNELGLRMDDLVSVLQDICKLEEDSVCESTPELREAMVIVDTNKYVVED